MQLEYDYMSHITGKTEYSEKVCESVSHCTAAIVTHLGRRVRRCSM